MKLQNTLMTSIIISRLLDTPIVYFYSLIKMGKFGTGVAMVDLFEGQLRKDKLFDFIKGLPPLVT